MESGGLSKSADSKGREANSLNLRGFPAALARSETTRALNIPTQLTIYAGEVHDGRTGDDFRMQLSMIYRMFE